MGVHSTISADDRLETTGDFETVAEDPESYYAAPADVLCDPDLTCDDKRLLLEEWVRDLEALAVADDEGMAPEDDAQRLRDTERLRAATNALGLLRGEEDSLDPARSAPSRALGRLWRKVTGAGK